jgi:hypothetical protein
MDDRVAAGATSMGVLIGALVGWFVNEAEEMSEKILVSSASVLSGGGVLALFHFLADPTAPKRELWLYPCGLLIGFVIVTIIEIVEYGYKGEREKDKAKQRR